MKRIDCINRIVTYAARFVLEVEGFNATGQYHINIHAESFLIPVLNEVLGVNLENLNATQKKNFPAVDLADFKNRVAVQVTATTGQDKISHTLQTFFEHNLQQQFDVLYIFIITHKKERYNEQKIQNQLSEGFSFNTNDHVMDKDNLLQQINNISATPRLEMLAKIFEHEFSDVQIEMRKQKFEYGYLTNEPENLYPNLLPISLPEKLYVAKLNIDEDAITEKVNGYLTAAGKKAIKKLKPGKLVKHALKLHGLRCNGWILHERNVYTFRDLEDSKEPFRNIVDKGAIESIRCSEYFTQSDDAKNVFKHLLRNTLMDLAAKKEMEWFSESEVFRFANNQEMPNQKRLKWKGKNEATKTVIFEMTNKKMGHVICYRSLAFKPSFEEIEGSWFLVVNPSWSFTNPYGYRTSRFESAYMAGIKRLENNSSVYNYFRFFGYHLNYQDLFTEDFPYMKINRPLELSFSPALDERTWKPAKFPETSLKGIDDTELKADTELNKTLFD